MAGDVEGEHVVPLGVQQAGLALQVLVHHAGGAVVEAVRGQHLAALGARRVHGGAHLGRKHLAQLHAPLVKRVDAPHKALPGQGGGVGCTHGLSSWGKTLLLEGSSAQRTSEGWW